MDMLQDEILQEKQANKTIQDQMHKLPNPNPNPNWKAKKALQDQIQKLEGAKVAAALAPAGSTGGGGLDSAKATELLLTITSLQKANAALRSRLTTQQASELNVVAGLGASVPGDQLKGEIAAFKKSSMSMLASPKVVDLTQKRARPRGAAADPGCRFRQEFSEVYKTELRCKTLQAQLAQHYLASTPGAKAETQFGLFPSEPGAKQMHAGTEGRGVRVGTVRLPQQMSTGVHQLQLDHAQFKRMHAALVN